MTGFQLAAAILKLEWSLVRTAHACGTTLQRLRGAINGKAVPPQIASVIEEALRKQEEQ